MTIYNFPSLITINKRIHLKHTHYPQNPIMLDNMTIFLCCCDRASSSEMPHAQTTSSVAAQCVQPPTQTPLFVRLKKQTIKILVALTGLCSSLKQWKLPAFLGLKLLFTCSPLLWWRCIQTCANPIYQHGCSSRSPSPSSGAIPFLFVCWDHCSDLNYKKSGECTYIISCLTWNTSQPSSASHTLYLV